MSVAALSMLGSFDAFLPGNAKHAKPKWSSALAAGVSPMEEMLEQLKADAEKEREKDRERDREKTSAVTRVSSPVPGIVEREPVQMGSKTRDRSDALVGGFVSAGGSRVGNPCHEKAACGFTDQAARKAAGGSGSFGQNDECARSAALADPDRCGLSVAE